MIENSVTALRYAGNVSLGAVKSGPEALSEFLISGERTGHRVRGASLAGAWHAGGASLVAASDGTRLYFTLLGAETGLVEEAALRAVYGPVRFTVLGQVGLSVLFRLDGPEAWRITVCPGTRLRLPFRGEPQVERPFAFSTRLCFSREHTAEG